MDTMVAPIEINYTGLKRTNKFYAFVNFMEGCSVNITPKITVLADPVVHRVVQLEEPSYSNPNDINPPSNNFHSDLISEIEKLDVAVRPSHTNYIGMVESESCRILSL